MLLRSIEICAGAGGQALGLEKAGFEHVALVEIDKPACETLRHNRPKWKVINTDVRSFSGKEYRGVELLAGGVPCPPFSAAGKQLGKDDERDLFPEALRLVSEIKPMAVMLENVRGLLSPKFESYRKAITQKLLRLGYIAEWKLLHASDFGVPQLRPRVICVGLRKEIHPYFKWPEPTTASPKTVGDALHKLMAEDGWPGAPAWKEKACSVAPTLVGGSKKHGGADLGPTRAKREWAKLGVDAMGLAEHPPGPNHKGMPRLTIKMAAAVQGFPNNWTFMGKKTPAYRQIGNAFPPPVAQAVGKEIAKAINAFSKAK